MTASIRTNYRSCSSGRTSFPARPCLTEFSHSLGGKRPVGSATKLSGTRRISAVRRVLITFSSRIRCMSDTYMFTNQCNPP